MIEVGWITPDGTEIRCGGDSWIVHELAVKKFIRGLRFQNLELKKIIDKEINDLFWKRGSKNLYSLYAIERLGWIKIGAGVWYGIQYAGFDWQEDLLFPYREAGYSINNLHLSSKTYLEVSCNIILAIKNGNKMYHEDGSCFKYDGTDKDDYYVDEMGRLRLAPWSN